MCELQSSYRVDRTTLVKILPPTVYCISVLLHLPSQIPTCFKRFCSCFKSLVHTRYKTNFKHYYFYTAFTILCDYTLLGVKGQIGPWRILTSRTLFATLSFPSGRNWENMLQGRLAVLVRKRGLHWHPEGPWQAREIG